MNENPNIVFVFGDQWRAQALGYTGDPNVHTPRLDALAEESVNVTHALSGCPVCSPYRACLMTGQYPLTHGVFVNDVGPRRNGPALAESFRDAGYDTAYIGKWHIDGHGRTSPIPPERRMGFDYWKVLECTHDYNRSPYYDNASDARKIWEGYDAIAQTRDAAQYIRNHDPNRPFLLMLSWGPPHNPYETAPEEFQRLYDPDSLVLRPNVPEVIHDTVRRDLAGYYAHCSALDACAGELLDTLESTGLADNTIFIFTSDHGDMLGSQGGHRKQCPFDESVRVPFLLRWPKKFGPTGRNAPLLLDAPDIMPTLLGLCGIAVPGHVEGRDWSDALSGTQADEKDAALLASYQPFSEWRRDVGGREYRGVRTLRHTYVRTRTGPWLLFDNTSDPYQMNNLVGDPAYADTLRDLDSRTDALLAARRDPFSGGADLMQQWGYPMDASGAVPYHP